MQKPGKYYIGVYTDSPASQGMIVIDDIELKRHEERPPFYLSDFTNHFDDWTAYKLYPNTFDQWTKTKEEGKEYDIVQLKTFKVYAPGIFVSPGFRIEQGQPIDLEMEYALLTSNESDRFGLYMGNENHPDSLTRLIAELPATSGWESYSKQITATETGRYFFAVKAQRATTEKDVYYKLGAFKLTPAGLNEYELKGILTDTAGNPIPEAEVKLTGGQSQRTLTDKDGVFLFDKVMEQQNFILEITKERFFPHTQAVKLEGAANNLGTLVLRYELLPPTGVSASVNPDNQVELEWRAPGSITEFRYDDGTSFGQVGFNSGTASDVMGNVFRTPALLQEISWYTNPAPMIHDKVNIYLLDLDPNGNPTNSILYEATDVPAKDSEWCSHWLNRPVNAPNGFLVAISYNNGSLGLAIDDGIDDYAFQNNTCYTGSLLTGTFSTFESQGGKSNFLLRAKGIPTNTVSSQALLEKAAAKTISYQIYRFEKANEHNQANWMLLTPQPIARTNFKEEVSALNGTYRYAVKALYPSKEVSEAAISNEITITNNGIVGGNETAEVHIWPVPAKESVTVSSASPVVWYIIRNPLGIVVANEQIDQKDFVIPLGKLRAGHYLVSLYTEDSKVERKIIKQ